jgi:hypothetical protein
MSGVSLPGTWIWRTIGIETDGPPVAMSEALKRRALRGEGEGRLLRCCTGAVGTSTGRTRAGV